MMFFDESLIFRWSFAQNPDHFIIRTMEENDDPEYMEIREIWNSEKIDGDIRFFKAATDFNRPYNKEYYWQIEAHLIN